jgi:hypothetical protein
MEEEGNNNINNSVSKEKEKEKDSKEAEAEEENYSYTIQSVGVKSLFRPTTAVLNPVRKIISKDRVRFKDGNIDLDLTYITPEVVGKTLTPFIFKELISKSYLDEILLFNFENNLIITTLNPKFE